MTGAVPAWAFYFHLHTFIFHQCDAFFYNLTIFPLRPSTMKILNTVTSFLIIMNEEVQPTTRAPLVHFHGHVLQVGCGGKKKPSSHNSPHNG